MYTPQPNKSVEGELMKEYLKVFHHLWHHGVHWQSKPGLKEVFKQNNFT
jgi:hypothetical protein